jgi:hypothetical protein
MRRNSSRVAAAASALLVAAVIALTACGRSAPRATTPSPQMSTSAIERALPSAGLAMPTLPLAAYTPTPKDLAVTRNATAILADQCLAKYGVPKVLKPDAPVEADLGDRRYGVTIASNAREFGYHLTPAQDDTPTQAQLQARNPTLTTQEQMLLTGGRSNTTIDGLAVPPGGCLGAAAQVLNGGHPVLDTSLVTKLDQALYSESMTTPQVRAAFTDWSNCMAAEGIKATDPMSLLSAQDLKPPHPSQQEILTAEADVGCKARTDLVRRWAAVETTLQDAAINQHRTQLEAIRGQLARQAQTARTVVAH